MRFHAISSYELRKIMEKRVSNASLQILIYSLCMILKHLSLLRNFCSTNSTAKHLKPSDYLRATGVNIKTLLCPESEVMFLWISEKTTTTIASLHGYIIDKVCVYCKCITRNFKRNSHYFRCLKSERSHAWTPNHGILQATCILCPSTFHVGASQNICNVAYDLDLATRVSCIECFHLI